MADPIQKLPTLEIIREAIHYTYMNFGLTFKAALPWAVIYMLFTFVFVLFGIADYLELVDLVAFVTENPRDARQMGLEKLEVLVPRLEALTQDLGILIPIHLVMDNLIKIFAYAAVAVMVFRTYMLNADFAWISMGLREIKTFIYLLIIGAVLAGLGYVIAQQAIPDDMGFAATGICYGIIGFILAFFVVRFLLPLPAVAMDHTGVGFIQSWILSRGQNWRLFGGMILVVFSSVPVSVFKLMVNKIALPIYVTWSVQLLLSMIIVTFIAVFLAICYQYLVLGRKEEIQAPLF